MTGRVVVGDTEKRGDVAASNMRIEIGADTRIVVSLPYLVTSDLPSLRDREPMQMPFIIGIGWIRAVELDGERADIERLRDALTEALDADAARSDS